MNQITNAPTNNEVIDKVNEIITNMVGYGTSDSAADATTKVVSIPSITTLNTGQVIIVKPSITSTVASSKIQLNNFTAYNMRYNGANITTSTDSVVWNSAWVSWFVFDGTYWQFAGHGYDNNTNTTYSAMSVSEGTTGTATNSRTVRADYLKQIIQGTTLTGLSTSTNSAVVATDSITTGIGKLQAQITASKILINITYDDLVTLKTNGELYEGAFYRITDYVTTCNAYTPRTGEPSRSAGHQFDIIIQALSSSTLSDTGTASLHSGDTYFANCNLGAWKVYYDIENDTNKYKWADTTNGKGVIYRLIDERGNDLPYDFKNIQFYRDGSSSSYTSVASYLTASDGYYYTFSLNSSGTITDYSIAGGSYCQKNIHGALGVGQGIGLPNSVWIETATSKELSNNDIGSNSYNNTCCGVFQRIHCPLGAFTNNITGDTFRNSTIASNFKNNVIGTSFDNNSIGNWFTNNTIGSTFKLNTVGESVRYCTFGTTTQYSRIGNYVVYMTFGNSFNTGVIENYVSYISIPANTYNLTIKNNTSGASGSVLDCSGLPTSVNYSVTLRLDVNSGYIATWNDGITEYGKYKATSSTATWTDVNNKQIQADWNQSDNTAVDYIKNKPSGLTVDQTYDGTSANAQSGVAIEGAGFLQNTATGTNSLTINGTSNANLYSINIGSYTQAATNSVAIGSGTNSNNGATASGANSIAIGYASDSTSNSSIAIGYISTASGISSIAIGNAAIASGSNSIQIGDGNNSTGNTLQIGFHGTNHNYTLLDGLTGLIPDARLSSNIARTSQIPTVPTNISSFTNDSGYITGISSSDVTTALGYTPESSSNLVTSISSSSTDTQYPSAKSVVELLKTIYPVGSVYLSTNTTCPMASLFGTWTLVSSGKALWTGDGTNGDTTIAAGLPNITGQISAIASGSSHSATGAFSSSDTGNCTLGTSGGSDYRKITLNASRVSSIYSDSVTTVQPPAYVINVWKRTA